jgi:putative hemolysin
MAPVEIIPTDTIPKNMESFDLGLPRWITPLVKRILGLDAVEKVYETVRAEMKNEQNVAHFCAKALEVLGVACAFPRDRIDELRALKGPLVFVANHPFGGVDALALMMLMGEVRVDFRFMANSILKTLPELAPVLVPVDIMGNAGDAPANVGPMREIYRHLADGGTVGIFPAGEVATFDSWRAKQTVERPWHPHVGRIIRKTRATVVPVFIEGRNSLVFQYLGLALPPVRIALIAREILKTNSPLRVRIGVPIPYDPAIFPADASQISGFLQRKTFALAD